MMQATTEDPEKAATTCRGWARRPMAAIMVSTKGEVANSKCQLTHTQKADGPKEESGADSQAAEAEATPNSPSPTANLTSPIPHPAPSVCPFSETKKSSSLPPKSACGFVMKRTPAKLVKADVSSRGVKGSLRKRWPMKPVKQGVRKDRVVESDLFTPARCQSGYDERDSDVAVPYSQARDGPDRHEHEEQQRGQLAARMQRTSRTSDVRQVAQAVVDAESDSKPARHTSGQEQTAHLRRAEERVLDF